LDRQERTERRRQLIAELNQRAVEADLADFGSTGVTLINPWQAQ
jgi:hypothetical protein